MYTINGDSHSIHLNAQLQKIITGKDCKRLIRRNIRKWISFAFHCHASWLLLFSLFCGYLQSYILVWRTILLYNNCSIINILGIWKQDLSMALVICRIHSSSILSLAVFLHSQWLDICIQHLYLFILGSFDFIFHLELASSIFIIRRAKRFVKIGGFGTFTGE